MLADRMSGQERRRHQRHEATGLRGSLVHSLDARVLNISLAGIAVETTSQVEVGNKLAVRLARNSDELGMVATVRWCHLAGTDKAGGEVQPVYQAGLAFDEILSDAAHNVLQFIEQAVVVDVETRLFGRVDVLEDQPITLESDHELAVKKISQSGMLIEAAIPPVVDEELSVEISLDDLPFVAQVRVVSVTRVTVESHRLRYHLGVELVGLDEGQRMRLASFIRRDFEEA